MSEISKQIAEMESQSMTAREYALLAIDLLNHCPKLEWAKTFVYLKIRFHYKYCHGLITSIAHGSDWFKNIVGCLDGTMTWDERGEYGNNFRRIIELNKPLVK